MDSSLRLLVTRATGYLPGARFVTGTTIVVDGGRRAIRGTE
jgi:hypothetical protein